MIRKWELRRIYTKMRAWDSWASCACIKTQRPNENPRGRKGSVDRWISRITFWISRIPHRNVFKRYGRLTKPPFVRNVAHTSRIFSPSPATLCKINTACGEQDPQLSWTSHVWTRATVHSCCAIFYSIFFSTHQIRVMGQSPVYVWSPLIAQSPNFPKTLKFCHNL